VLPSGRPAFAADAGVRTANPRIWSLASRLSGEPSLAMLFRYLSASRLVTIAQIEGRVRGVGSEFVLACDVRFAALAVHLMTNTAVTGATFDIDGRQQLVAV